jgi:surface polysaccharide O-acyltransferase-like enzyme
MAVDLRLSTELSERIAIVRFPLIVGVVFIHAYDPAIGAGLTLHYNGWAGTVITYISVGIAAVSVPLLFLISGYLFFYGFTGTPAGFYGKIRKRGRSLLIPLIFWNVLCLIVTGIAQALPATRQYFTGRAAPIASFTPFDYANAIVGVTHHPIAYQFWFIRDLLLLVLFSPLIYFVLKRVPWLFLSAIFVWWSLDNVWSMPVLSREAILFFSVGSLLGMHSVDLCAVDKIAVISWLYLPLSIADTFTKHTVYGGQVHRLSELCGVLTVLCLTKYIRQLSGYKNLLLALSASSFFLFACHEPLLTIVRKLSYQIFLSPNPAVVLALYFADPLLVTGFCVAAYYVCSRAMPQLTGVITGSRVAGGSQAG